MGRPSMPCGPLPTHLPNLRLVYIESRECLTAVKICLAVLADGVLTPCKLLHCGAQHLTPTPLLQSRLRTLPSKCCNIHVQKTTHHSCWLLAGARGLCKGSLPGHPQGLGAHLLCSKVHEEGEGCDRRRPEGTQGAEGSCHWRWPHGQRHRHRWPASRPGGHHQRGQ